MIFGNKEIKHGLVLGPMAGVTDKVYRKLCIEQGCEVTYTEMVSAKAIFYNNKKTDQLFTIDACEKVAGIQLFGREPQLMADMAKKIDHENVSFFDVNMGCPVPKVVNNGEGSALMKEPELIGEIVKALVQATQKPVSIKIRAGFSPETINAVEICKIAEANGASCVAIHGRTREQYYAGSANWDIIKAAKAAVSIPIIGNGDVFCGKDAKRLVDYTGCDGVMIGRGAMGNPWIFKEITSFLTGTDFVEPTFMEIKDMILRHGALLVEHKGESIAMKEMRKHVSWYTKGMKNSSHLREGINTLVNYDQLARLMEIWEV